jgi:hypothetical protein
MKKVLDGKKTERSLEPAQLTILNLTKKVVLDANENPMQAASMSASFCYKLCQFNRQKIGELMILMMKENHKIPPDYML